MKRKLIVILAILLVVLVGFSACEDDELPIAGLVYGKPNTDPAQKITEIQARDIALEHAGFTQEQVQLLVTTFDYEDGQPVYEVEFRVDLLEYEYHIHAQSGKIMSFDVDD